MIAKIEFIDAAKLYQAQKMVTRIHCLLHFFQVPIELLVLGLRAGVGGVTMSF